MSIEPKRGYPFSSQESMRKNKEWNMIVDNREDE